MRLRVRSYALAAGLLVLIACLALAQASTRATTLPARPPSAVEIELMLGSVRPPFGTSADTKARVAKVAHEIATRYGREATPVLLDAMLGDGGLALPGWTAAEALVEIADARAGRADLKARLDDPDARADLVGTALVAVAAPQDDGARAALLRAATYVPREKRFPSIDACRYACGLLRTFDSEGTRGPIEAAVRDERVPLVRKPYLRALLASLNYHDAMKDPKQREAYRAFEGRVWRNYALANKRSHNSNEEYRAAASAMRQEAEPVDERFILHVLESTETAGEETAVASYLAAYSASDFLRERLQALADGGGPRAKVARSTLDEMDRIDRWRRIRDARPKNPDGTKK